MCKCGHTHSFVLYRISSLFFSLSVVLLLFIVFHSPAPLFEDILIIEKRKVYHENSTSIINYVLCACEVEFIADNIDFFLLLSVGIGQDKLSYVGANGIRSNLFCHTGVRDGMIPLCANKVVISPY